MSIMFIQNIQNGSVFSCSIGPYAKHLMIKTQVRGRLKHLINILIENKVSTLLYLQFQNHLTKSY